MREVANVNGTLSLLEDAKIPVTDRGFLYGDSLYEVIIIENGFPMFLNEHLERTHKSAEKMRMKLSISDEELTEEIRRTVEFYGEKPKRVYCRWVITRGNGPITLANQIQPNNFIIIVKEFPVNDDPLTSTVSVKVTDIQRNSEDSMDPNIKSGNYLNNILALDEANSGGFNDCLMSRNGYLCELSRANFWIFSNETWSTPAKHVLSGITRAKIIEALTAAGIKAEIRDIKIEEILEAEEVALSSTTKNLYPLNLVHLRGKNYRFESRKNWIEANEVIEKFMLEYKKSVQPYF